MYKSGISNISKINKIIVKSGNKKIVTEYWVQAQPAMFRIKRQRSQSKRKLNVSVYDCSTVEILRISPASAKH